LVLKWLAQTPSNFFSQISSNNTRKEWLETTIVFLWLGNNTRKEWLHPHGHQTKMRWQDGFTLGPFAWLGTTSSNYPFLVTFGLQNPAKCMHCIL